MLKTSYSFLNSSNNTENSNFYRLTEECEKNVTLKCDQLRSNPLFFSVSPAGIEIADHLPASQYSLNPQSIHDFTRTGYVTGSDTLAANWQQVQAAEEVIIDKTTGVVRREKYWEFLPLNAAINESCEVKSYRAMITDALITSAKETLALANGRQIVVPLSGGYDSRAILLALLKVGATNIVTFTFGRPSSPEVQLSQRIAKELNLPWHCVTYNRRLWRKIGASQQFKNYLAFICSGVSVPNVQLYPALQELTESGFIDQDAIALPGHTGDFVSGGHIPEELMVPYTHTDQLGLLAQVIVKKHYKFSRDMRSEVPEKLRKHLYERFSALAGKGYPLASLFEAWECSERQAKFIVNSNRYYEFFGLSWHMPLWQSDFVDTWIEVPYPLRKNKVLWIEAIEQLWMDITGTEQPLGDAEQHLSAWQLKWKHRLDYFFDNNHLLSLVPFPRWLAHKLRLSKRNGTLYGCLADKMIGYYSSGSSKR